MSTDNFRNVMSKTVAKLTLDEANWAAPEWKELWSLITQDVLDDAHSKSNNIEFLNVIWRLPRPCKRLARVRQKMTEQHPGRENYFKVVSDFLAYRCHSKVHCIPSVIDDIQAQVTKHSGVMHVRGSTPERPYGYCQAADGTLTDIVQYVYVYFEEVGCPIELQIGHQFAAYTFTNDSRLRDDPECDAFDFWTDNFYTDVKQQLLLEANQAVAANRQRKLLLEKAERLCEGKDFPKHLYDILHTL